MYKRQGETVVSLRLPEKLCIRIESVGTEDIDADDGKIVYDIRFPLYYNNRTIKFLVNVEAQRSTSNNKLGYHIESRIAYYMARMVSSQKNVEFIKSNYDELKDIYSIWICMDTQDGEDSIIELGIQPKLLYGKSNWMPKRSIMNGAIIRIRAVSYTHLDYMEFGYKASKEVFNVDDYGKWKFCDEKDIREIVGDNNTCLLYTSRCV